MTSNPPHHPEPVSTDHGEPKVGVRWKSGFFYLDSRSWAMSAAGLSDEYRHKEPFPHIIIENFIDPLVLDRALDNFPKNPDTSSRTFERDQERHKTQFVPDALENSYVSLLFNQLNGQAFLDGLETLTGIKGLIPDPYFMGGGFHETKPGGKLDVHTDFNFHEALRLERRVNLILFLNKEWQEGYGGELELWDAGMETRYALVPPVFNTAVIFNTSLESFHGHPDPLRFPEGESRKSIALYYYTSPVDSLGAKPHRTTVFRPRPGSADRPDYAVKWRHLAEDWCPPIILRAAKRIWRRP